MNDSQIVEYGKRKMEHFSDVDADSDSASGVQVDYKFQITASSKRQRKKYKAKPKNESHTTFKTRSTLVGLFEFMNSNPSERQINDIEEIGFGSLLRLQNNKVPGRLALWLIENFNEGECSIMNGKLLIDEEDIHLVTGLPRGPLTITQKSNEKLRNKFCSQFEKGAGVLTTVLLEKIKSQKDGGKSFKRNFLIYVISSFLWGVKGAHPTLKFINCLSDMSRIKDFNWCRFTLDGLLNGMRLWNSENKKIKYFTGPIMVLVFLYLDRVQFNASSGPTRNFPIMCTWSKIAIREKIEKELKISGSFGRGRVLERISNDNSALQIVEVKASEGECSKKEEKVYQRRKKPRVAESREKEKKIFFKKFSETTFDFIKSYNNFYGVLKEGNPKIPMCKSLRLANALMESFKKGDFEDNEEFEEVNEDEEDEDVQMKENDHKGDEEENEKKESEEKKVKNSHVHEEKISDEMEVGEQKNVVEGGAGRDVVISSESAATNEELRKFEGMQLIQDNIGGDAREKEVTSLVSARKQTQEIERDDIRDKVAVTSLVSTGNGDLSTLKAQEQTQEREGGDAGDHGAVISSDFAVIEDLRKFEGRELIQENIGGFHGAITTIDLSSDDEDDEVEIIEVKNKKGVTKETESAEWCCMGPTGGVRGPYRMSILKQWTQLTDSYASQFKVWRVGQKPENGIPLLNVFR